MLTGAVVQEHVQNKRNSPRFEVRSEGRRIRIDAPDHGNPLFFESIFINIIKILLICMV